MLGLALGASGCVYAYQPMSGLHRPVVIDTTVANFTDLELDIYCPPAGKLTTNEAAGLCRKVQVLFENQGALVRTSVLDRVPTDDAASVEDGPPRSVHLSLELRPREVHESSDPLSWLLCVGTFTLAPAVTEDTFAQDVIIRDEDGFLLLSDTLRGRIVRRFGIGAYGGNKLLDLVWRDDDEELVGDIAYRELSADLYQQLSQLVFNATMRATVLDEGPPAAGGTR